MNPIEEKTKTLIDPQVTPKKIFKNISQIWYKGNSVNYIDRTFSFAHFIFSFILVNLAYFGMHYYKRGTLTLEPVYYFKVLLLVYGLWFVVSLVMGKFKPVSFSSYKNATLLITRSNSIILYILALTVVMQGLFGLSRVQIFGTCLLLFLLELTSFNVYYYLHSEKDHSIHKEKHQEKIRLKNFSITLLVYDFLLLGGAFFLLNYYKRGHFTISTEYENILFVIYGVWFITSLFTNKFEQKQYRNYYHAIAPYIKSFLLSIGIMAVVVFAFRLFFYSRLHVFGTFSLFFVFELIFYYLYFITGHKRKKQHDVETISEVHKYLDQESLPFELDQIRKDRQGEIFSSRVKICDRLLKDYPSVCSFIDRHINLDEIDESDSVVLNTHTIFNVETIDDHAASLFVNLHKVNDFRWLNSYFLEVHKKIYNGGYFLGQGETLATRKKRFYSKYPKILAQILYPLNFLFVRVFPKLPVLQNIYFFFTRGRNRAISQAEILGRLCFCGFRIVATEEIDNSLYFIAQRAKTPSLEKNPSYGPLIQLRRIGYNKEVMYINKFRTMHPYSEFLQEYIFEQHELAENGKFFNDFRLTGWGRYFRKMWIDEWPQLINFFQGDLNLVGVRALSHHYFGLYPKELQELRTQFKPGLVPPYYADMPKTFEEIIESERQYLKTKQKHPLVTDIKYFFKASYNILFKHARSA